MTPKDYKPSTLTHDVNAKRQARPIHPLTLWANMSDEEHWILEPMETLERLKPGELYALLDFCTWALLSDDGQALIPVPLIPVQEKATRHSPSWQPGDPLQEGDPIPLSTLDPKRVYQHVGTAFMNNWH